MSKGAALHHNPFHLLGLTVWDDRHKIVSVAEERSLTLDHDTCQKARAALTNPRTRLSAEVAWMPGLAPRVAEELATTLLVDPLAVFHDERATDLARANLMAAALELSPGAAGVQAVTEYILNLAAVVEQIDANVVLRDINEDRSMSGFPEIRSVDQIEEELGERRKAYRSVLRNLLNSMAPAKLLEIMTETVAQATNHGQEQGPALIEDLADAYETEAQGFLQQEAENITELIKRAMAAAREGQRAAAVVLDSLERVARNWVRVAEPVQLSARSRGIKHHASLDVAFAIRDLAVYLNNTYEMPDLSNRLVVLLQALFAQLPEFAERLQGDAQALADLRRQAREEEIRRREWEQSITFRTEVGILFKDELAIGPGGIRWCGDTYPLEGVTRVRWGGVRRSVNGIPSGTTYTVAFGDATGQKVIELRKEPSYSGFIEALWRAVCVRLMFSLVAKLAAGERMRFGSITVEDGAVTLTKHRLLGRNEAVRVSWREVDVWSADGRFLVRHKEDEKIYGTTSYIEDWNAHLFEHIVRTSFKRGASRLSDAFGG